MVNRFLWNLYFHVLKTFYIIWSNFQQLLLFISYFRAFAIEVSLIVTLRIYDLDMNEFIK